MPNYVERISKLIDSFPLEIDKDIVIAGRPPTSATSEFLTNKEQGDWAERLVVKAINESTVGYVAVRYGRGDSIAAGDPSFAEFYRSYQEELNTIGKKPDVLLFRAGDEPKDAAELDDPTVVGRAIAAIEVRSSSFLCNKYRAAMEGRIAEAEKRCAELRKKILEEPYASLLEKKNPVILDLLRRATSSSFYAWTFRAISLPSTTEFRQLSAWMRELRDNIAILHSREMFGISVGLKEIALANRWVLKFGVPYYYLDAYLDCAYAISLEKLLTIGRDPEREGKDFEVIENEENAQDLWLKICIDECDSILTDVEIISKSPCDCSKFESRQVNS